MEKPHPISALCALFIENAEVSPVTKKTNEKILRLYAGYLKKNGIEYARRTDILDYLKVMTASGLKAGTIYRRLQVIKQFYRFLRIHQPHYDLDSRYLFDIAEGIKGPYVTKKHTRSPLTINQVEKLLAVVESKTDTITGIRNKAVILLMLITGMRPIEICRAKKEHASIIGGKDVLYVQGKRADETNDFVTLPQEVVDAVNEYLFIRRDRSPYLFISHSVNHEKHPLRSEQLSREIRSLMDEAGIRDPNTSVNSTLIYTNTVKKLNNEAEETVAKIIFKRK